VVDALLKAMGEGRVVYILLDYHCHSVGQAKNQSAAVARLVARGARVRFAKGRSLRGLYGPAFENKYGNLHAKAIFIGRDMVLGSLNWTRASSANLELGAVVKLSLEQRQWVMYTFWRNWDEAREASDQFTPKGDKGREAQTAKGYYGPVRWPSSSVPAPYGHRDADGPHYIEVGNVPSYEGSAWGADPPWAGGSASSVDRPQRDEELRELSLCGAGLAGRGDGGGPIRPSASRGGRGPTSGKGATSPSGRASWGLCPWCHTGRHSQSECPVRKCKVCYADTHFVRDCPVQARRGLSEYCTSCEVRGHLAADCLRRFKQPCSTCGDWGHTGEFCSGSRLRTLD